MLSGRQAGILDKGRASGLRHLGRRSQVVRRGSAKPLFTGSNPVVASKLPPPHYSRSDQDCFAGAAILSFALLMRQNDPSPFQGDPSPQRGDPSPRQNEASPRQKDPSFFQNDPSPPDGETPRSCGETPRSAGTTPLPDRTRGLPGLRGSRRPLPASRPRPR